MKTQSAPQDREVTRARYLGQQTGHHTHTHCTCRSPTSVQPNQACGASALCSGQGQSTGLLTSLCDRTKPSRECEHSGAAAMGPHGKQMEKGRTRCQD